MTKKKLSLFLFLMLVLSVLIPNFTVSAATGISIKINGNPIVFDDNSGVPFIDSANRTQVPLRITMETYGCQVSWNGSTQIATIQKDDTIVQVPIGQPYIIVDGIIEPTDTVAVIRYNRTYLPIRPVLESFGASVTWKQASQTVEIKELTGSYVEDYASGDSIEDLKTRTGFDYYRRAFYLTFAMDDFESYLTTGKNARHGQIWDALLWHQNNDQEGVFVELIEDLDFYFETGNGECEIMWAEIDYLYKLHCSGQSPIIELGDKWDSQFDKVTAKLDLFCEL